MNQLNYNLWSVIISVATGIIVLVGALIAIRNLRIEVFSATVSPAFAA
jgi:hypothetical protein